MKRIASVFLTAALLACLVPAALAQQGVPVKQVWAEQYNYWSYQSQQANSFIFSGTNCNSSPLTDGVSPTYFVFGNANTSVYYPVLIADANPSNSEIVTPTAISTVSSACGFSAAPANQHISFQVSSGTAGLQDAVGTLTSTALPAQTINVMLDRTYYQLVAALPNNTSVAGIIANLKGGSGNVNIIDTTTSPWTYYTWNGTNYTFLGTSVAAPTAAAGSGAGGSPTIALAAGSNSRSGIVNLTTGTAPPASDAIFTLTWVAPGSGGPGYALSCTISSIGTRAYTSGTTAVAYGSQAVLTFTASTTALTASVSGYQFAYHCN